MKTPMTILVQHRTRFVQCEENHRADEDEPGAERGSHGRRMHALVEGLHAQQADGADEREARAGEDEERGGGDHSITSPRSRNLASAAVETNPITPMMSAASK